MSNGRVCQTSRGSEARRLRHPARLGATCRVLRRLRRENCRYADGTLAHDQVSHYSFLCPPHGGRPDNDRAQPPLPRGRLNNGTNNEKLPPNFQKSTQSKGRLQRIVRANPRYSGDEVVWHMPRALLDETCQCHAKRSSPLLR